MFYFEKISNIAQNPKIVLPVVATAVAIAEVFLILAALQILPHGVNAISQLGVGHIVGVGCAIASPLILSILSYICRQKTDAKIKHEVVENLPGNGTLTETKDTFHTTGSF